MACSSPGCLHQGSERGQTMKNQEHLQRWRGVGRPSMKHRGGESEAGYRRGGGGGYKVEVGELA